MFYRKKPAIVEARQWLGPDGPTSIDDLIEWGAKPEPKGYWGPEDDWAFQIPTLHGAATVTVRDWVIKGETGDFWPCKPDIFAATYEAVEAGEQA